MKSPVLLHSLALLFVLCSTSPLHASDAEVIAAVRAADDERVSAIMAVDAARLDVIFSDDLSYTHSNGKHDTKKSYTQSLVARTTVYTVYDYKDRTFSVASPDIVIEKAHVLITSGTDAKQNPPNDLNIMAVWRKEAGKWRFLAWLSAKAPVPAASALAK